jgi:ubiquinone/menaquinone biosynthesis C-methylase UbiE
MDKSRYLSGAFLNRTNDKAVNLQKEELEFWDNQKRSGYEVELKLARDLPDDTPDFILQLISEFEKEAADFCFAGAEGRVLDAGCGNGNLLLRALNNDRIVSRATQFVGMDFSSNMLGRAARRADGRAVFLQGSVTCLPFQDQSFDWIVSSGVLTCLPSCRDTADALQEFNRVLKPGGVLVLDFFNRVSHYTLLRKHLFREPINPPEYVSPADFREDLEEAGFQVLIHRGFDFKPCQGYLFMSRWQPLLDPCFIQERLSQFMERKVVPKRQALSLLGYRVYARCIKEKILVPDQDC